MKKMSNVNNSLILIYKLTRKSWEDDWEAGSSKLWSKKKLSQCLEKMFWMPKNAWNTFSYKEKLH